MYIDRYDYELNNLNNEYLNEEIGLIEERLNEIEQSNISYFVKLKESMLRERKALKLETSFDLRLDNITNQIYTLQMKQFAESISNIKKDVKKNKYVLLFDPSECMEPLTLDEEDYKDLMKHRDPMNSISVYDLFQEKTHMY